MIRSVDFGGGSRATVWNALGLLVALAGLGGGGVQAQPQPEPESEPRPQLRVGIIEYKSREKVQESYEPLVGYLADQLGEEASVEILTDGRLAYRLNKGDFDIGIFTQFPYLEAKETFPELDVFASHEVRRSGNYEGAILVRVDSGIDNLADLRGKRFQFVKPTSTSGFKYPMGILREHRLESHVPEDLQKDEVVTGSFFEYGFSGDHGKSLRSLLDEEVDGVAIDLAAFHKLGRTDREQLKVLRRFELPYHAYVFRPDMNPERRAEIRQLMMDAVNEDAADPYFSNTLEITSWVARKDTDYNSLRRYLGMVRQRPTIALEIELDGAAREALEQAGDVVKVVERGISSALGATGRFDVSEATTAQTTHRLRLDIGRVGTDYHCQLSIDGVPQEPPFDALTDSRLVQRLPGLVAEKTLSNFPVETELLNAEDRWFITYGRDDGLSRSDYAFTLEPSSGAAVELPDEAILDIEGVSTSFRPRAGFESGAKIVASFRTAEMRRAEAAEEPERAAEIVSVEVPAVSDKEGFWENRDNRWGVFGIVFALALAGGGWYLSQRKKRRFKDVRNETLQLLSLYVESKYDVAVKIAEQREKIHRYLDQGHISENQYLILKDHIAEVERVIQRLSEGASDATQALDAELRSVMEDGVVTDKELTALAERATPDAADEKVEEAPSGSGSSQSN